MKTRLKERTQSFSDLKEIVDSKHHLPKEEYTKIKSKLTNAVFEEWYFHKLKESEEKKRMELEKQEEELIEKETKKVEMKEKAAEDFKNWLKGKQEQMKKAQCSKNYAKKCNFRNVAALAILFGQVSTFLKDSTTFVYGLGEILVKNS